MLTMICTPTSDNVNRFGHDGVNLYIEFKKTRQVYIYADVPEATFHAMREATSVGSFFHACIKKAFDCQKVLEPEARSLGFEEQVAVSA